MSWDHPTTPLHPMTCCPLKEPKRNCKNDYEPEAKKRSYISRSSYSFGEVHMKIFRGILILVLPVILLASAAWPAVAAPPVTGGAATVTLLNALPTDLAVGQSYTVNLLVESSEPFTSATAQDAVHFPAYLSDTRDNALHATSAVL